MTFIPTMPSDFLSLVVMLCRQEEAMADVNAQPLRYCTSALGGDQTIDEPDYLCSRIAGHDGRHEDREPDEPVTWTDDTPGSWYLSEHNAAAWDLSD